MVNLNEQQIQTFYSKTEFDPRLPIKKGKSKRSKSAEEFVTAFKKVIGLQLFSWVGRLVEGYRKEGMNMEDGEMRGQDIHKKLTMLSNERQRTQTESMGFKSEEHDSMQ